MAPTTEFLTATRYYFNTNSFQEKPILSIESTNVNTPPTEQIQGVGKGGMLQRQSLPTATKTGTIKLKLSLTSDTAVHDWYYKFNKPYNESAQYEPEPASIIAYNQAGDQCAEWQFTHCFPTNYSPPQFQAGGGDTAYEQIELSYSSIRRVQ